MEYFSHIRRVFFASVLCALALWMGNSGVLGHLAEFLGKPHMAAFLIYLETGRDVRFFPSLEAVSPYFVESSPAQVPEKAVAAALPFYEKVPEIWNQSGVEADLEGLLKAPLDWQLVTAEPTVFVFHTHTTESYTRKNEPYREVSPWRTLDPKYNMSALGAELGRLLTAAGISVAVDDTVHDHPGYNGSYIRARKTLKAALEEHPSVRLVLDLHRDAAGEGAAQLRPLAEKDGVTAARIMLVVGTNHENYQQNLSLALKLHAQLERQFPGITRPLQLRSSRFNQDLHPNMVLVEVGAAGDTLEEALAAIEPLAQAIISLSG